MDSSCSNNPTFFAESTFWLLVGNFLESTIYHMRNYSSIGQSFRLGKAQSELMPGATPAAPAAKQAPIVLA